LISGACFIIPQGSITSVFAVERTNPANVIQATNFVVLNNNLIDALFNFTSANAGKTFLIFVTGPGGTSRNLTTAVAGAPAGCPLGNEQESGDVHVFDWNDRRRNKHRGGNRMQVNRKRLQFFPDVWGRISSKEQQRRWRVTPKKIR
jgi:hypothetical protein